MTNITSKAQSPNGNKAATTKLKQVQNSLQELLSLLDSNTSVEQVADKAQRQLEQLAGELGKLADTFKAIRTAKSAAVIWPRDLSAEPADKDQLADWGSDPAQEGSSVR